MSVVYKLPSRSFIRCMPSARATWPGLYLSRARLITSATRSRTLSTDCSRKSVLLLSSKPSRQLDTRNGLFRPMLIGAPQWSRPHTNSQNNYGRSSAENENTNFILMIIGANLLVFLAWQSVIMRKQQRPSSASTSRRGPDPPPAQELAKILSKYFTLRVDDPKNGNYLSSLGSAFSHTNTTHFLGNMITMYAFGSRVGAVPGIRIAHLAQLVVGSALCGSAGFVLFESREGSQGRNKIALGASGVVMGFGAAAFALVPRARFLIYGIVPIQIGLLIPAYFALDAYYLDDPNSRTAHSGHLGGAAFGLLFCALRFRGVGGIFGRR